MIWFIVCGGTLFALISWAIGSEITDDAEWYISIPVGAVFLIIVLGLLIGFIYGWKYAFDAPKACGCSAC